MNEIKSKADLFEAAAKMMRMCDEAGVEYAFKYKELLHNFVPAFSGEFQHYEFPLAIVEGEPVFKGDELYDREGNKRKAHHVDNSWHGGLSIWNEYGCFAHIENCSWLPPKPRTVMVELLREDAEYYADEQPIMMAELEALIERRKEACRKALEELK